MTVEWFNTDPFPVDQRTSTWEQALSRVGLAAASESAMPEGRLLRHCAPQGTEIVLIAGGPQRLLRAPRAGSGQGWLGTLLEGAARLPGDAIVRERDLLCWPAAAGPLLTLSGRFRLLLLRLPRLDLRWDADADGEPLRPGRQPVLGALLATIAEAMQASADGALATLEVALGEIMPAALGMLPGGRTQRAALQRRILRALERRLDDPHLNLARFAEAEGLSMRAVQKLLEEEGRSFSQYLRHRRLERAGETLGDLSQAALPVAEIAFRCGFQDPAHFSRAFRQHYGVSPNTYRADAHLHGRAAPPQPPRSRGYPQPCVRREAPPARYPQPRVLPHRDGPAHHHLRATPATVHWGYFSSALPPVLTVRSGDTITIETLTQHASDDAARMIAGDSDAEAVFRWTAEAKLVDRRGAGPLDASIYGRGAGEGFGVHILTGPIMVEEARPGDVLEVEMLEIAPRPSAAPGFAGRSFGSNAAVWWGRHYDDLLTPPKPREVITIYEICRCGGRPCAHAAYSFRWTPQRDPFGVLHRTIDYPGVPVDHATIEQRLDVLRGVHIPVRLHFGTIGLAPDHPEPLDSVPPSAFGGNIDNWRLGPGAKLYLPVSLPGAMLSIGDPHAAQGDGELSGTAIECSLTGRVRVRVHSRQKAGPMVRDLTYPLIETPESWIVQGFSHADYLADLGAAAQSEIYQQSSLDTAMRDAFRKARRFLMTAHGMSEDEAISVLSVAVDFGITQVVDGNWGVHAIIPKVIFAGEPPSVALRGSG
ncbi:MAG TPA: acetamidase/formamidase family protein [Acetobacteraceae bacterium]|nr:acetamidase/formamidase family protein [Acetobacteraceae bacterium]